MKTRVIKRADWKHQWSRYGTEEWQLSLYNDGDLEITTQIEAPDTFQAGEDIGATIYIPSFIIRKFLQSKSNLDMLEIKRWSK